MKLYANTTSPYARIARIALAEKGFAVDVALADPWADSPELLAVNPAARVPALVLDDGRTLTECLLIVMWAEQTGAGPSLLGDEGSRALSVAGTAMGLIDAAVATLIGRRAMGPGFDASAVGERRNRTMDTNLTRLDDAARPYAGGPVTLDQIASVVALDYLGVRFPDRRLPETPRLEALRAALNERPAFAASRPFL
jgi:glutathione S-transferase